MARKRFIFSELSVGVTPELQVLIDFASDLKKERLLCLAAFISLKAWQERGFPSFTRNISRQKMRLKSRYRDEAQAALEAERQERREMIAEVRGEPLPAATMPSLPDPFNLAEIAPMPVVLHDNPMMVAAPPNGTGGRPGFDPAKTKFTLSKEEAEIARISGISYAQYCINREQLEREKQLGLRQNG